MCGFCYVWVCVCVGVLILCVLVFTVFLYCFVYVYLFIVYFCLILQVMYFYCYVYVFLLLCTLCSVYSVFIVPTGTLQLPWLRFLHAFSSVIRQMPGYKSQRQGTACTLPKLIVLFCVLFVCKCVLYCCHTGCQPNCSYIYIYICHNCCTVTAVWQRLLFIQTHEVLCHLTF